MEQKGWSGTYLRCKLTGKPVNIDEEGTISVLVGFGSGQKKIRTGICALNDLFQEAGLSQYICKNKEAMNGFDLAFFTEMLISAEEIPLKNSVVLISAISKAGGDINLSRAVA